MPNRHNNTPRRVPGILGLIDQQACLRWHEVSLTFDEVRDAEAAKDRLLIVYVNIHVLIL
jgi:hypothetical protein